MKEAKKIKAEVQMKCKDVLKNKASSCLKAWARSAVERKDKKREETRRSRLRYKGS